jgi:molybdate transport system substrate-binding protein
MNHSRSVFGAASHGRRSPSRVWLERRIRRAGLAALLLAFGMASIPAAAAEIRLLSGGAVEPGLKPVVAAFEAASGHTVRITFNSAPQIQARIAAGESWDAVIAPAPILDAFAGAAGRIGTERVGVGRVGLGVAVREGAPLPEIGDVDAVKRSIVGAESIVFNRASTGQIAERMFGQLGLAEIVAAKATRLDDGAQVMERLLRGQGREIGFGALTEILLFRERGIRLVGPLPAGLQTYTTYVAAIPASGTQAAAARQLLEHLSSRASHAAFEAAGIDPAP